VCEVGTDEEAVLLAKTTDERYDALRDRVVERQPYEVPCIERFDESGILDAFGSWRAESVGRSETARRGPTKRRR